MSMMIHRHKKARAAKQAALIAKKVVQKPQTVVEEKPQQQELANAKKTYTKSEIARMSTLELQTLANDEGVENAFNISGAELKKILVEHFGL